MTKDCATCLNWLYPFTATTASSIAVSKCVSGKAVICNKYFKKHTTQFVNLIFKATNTQVNNSLSFPLVVE